MIIRDISHLSQKNAFKHSIPQSQVHDVWLLILVVDESKVSAAETKFSDELIY